MFARVVANRADLRFALPADFAGRLQNARLSTLGRRGKYLIAALSTGESLIMHLGMSGRFTVSRPPAAEDGQAPGGFYYAGATNPAHDHVIFEMTGPNGPARILYNDPRRFGFMDLVPTGALDESRHFAGMGPEPLSDAFTAEALNVRLKGRRTSIKAALLDQRVVAGVGNIYACEALHRARISPRRLAASVAGARGARLRNAVREVLLEAIAAGGSSLRDFAGTEGALGYFQHRFAVYDRAGAACPVCGGALKRIVQSARATYYCGRCQR